MADWKQMEGEYVTSRISYRALAEKHGVAYGTVRYRAAKEGWAEKRRSHAQQVREKILEADTTRCLDRMARIMQVGDLLLGKVETLAGGDAGSNPTGIKTLAESLRIIRDAQMIKESTRTENNRERITVVLEQVKEFAE